MVYLGKKRHYFFRKVEGDHLVCGCADNAYVSRWGVCNCMEDYVATGYPFDDAEDVCVSCNDIINDPLSDGDCQCGRYSTLGTVIIYR